MLMGTLESIFLTPTRVTTIAISYAIFGSLFGVILIFLLFVVGFVCFGVMVFNNATYYTLIIFILSWLLMLGFGMIFMGLTVWIKNIGQLIPFIQNLTMFFCGVYFPISVLPTYIQPIAEYIPFYYSIEGLRKSLVSTTPAEVINNYILKLLLLAVIAIILGVYTLSKGVKKAKRDGSLSFY